MLDQAREAVEIIRQRSRADLDGDRVLQLALRQVIQIVGEAANRVSKEGQARYPDIPWRAAIAARRTSRREASPCGLYFVTGGPKPREVFAADFRDRIVHHLLVAAT